MFLRFEKKEVKRLKNANRGLLVIVAVLLLVTIGLSSFAIYKSSAEGSATASVATWAVSVNEANIVQNDAFTFDADDIDWDDNDYIADDKIAPGRVGYIPVTIDASGSEVAVEYTAEIGDTFSVANDNISVSIVDSNKQALANGTGVIALANVSTPVTVYVKITWTAEDETDQNTADLALSGTDITIPVIITAKQYLG